MEASEKNQTLARPILQEAWRSKEAPSNVEGNRQLRQQELATILEEPAA
mgnify:CR=1 FL=1